MAPSTKLSNYFKIHLAKNSLELNWLVSTYESTISQLVKHHHHDKIKIILKNILEDSKLFIGIYWNLLKRQTFNVFKKNDEYYLNGFIPYVTGYKFHNKILITAVYERENSTERWTIIMDYKKNKNLEIIPLNLAYPNTCNTCMIKLKDFKVTDDMILLRKDTTIPVEHKTDSIPPQIYYLVGLSYQILDRINTNAFVKDNKRRKIYDETSAKLKFFYNKNYKS